MKVALVARSVFPLHGYGGLERHVYDLARCLADRNVAVTLVAPPYAPSRPQDRAADAILDRSLAKAIAVPYQTFPFANRRGTTVLDRSTAYPLFGYRAGRIAADLVSAGAVDIVHAFGASALGYALAPPGVRRRAPFVLNPQGMEEFGATDPSRAGLKRLAYWPLQVAVRRSARVAQCVIATDRVLVEPVLKHLQVSAEVVRMIPNAIEPAECDSAASAGRAEELRRSIGLSSGGRLLVSVGRLEANKGFDVMVRALERLVITGRLPSEWRWVLVGDGPQRASLEQQIARAGLGGRVILRGREPKEDLHAWYEAATVFVHPTLYEGSSIVTLEAMAHRRAVIASNAGGLPDKVVPGETGWLVPPGDDRPLADAIADAIGDPSRLVAMGTAGRVLVEREFSWTAAADLLLVAYRDLLSRSGSM